MSTENEIQQLLKTAMDSLRQILDVNTIIGDIIQSNNGISVIPVSKISCGFVAGGGEYATKIKGENIAFAGGSGAGISLQPMAFLVLQEDNVRLIPVSGSTSLDKTIEAVPLLAEQIKKFLPTEASKN